MYSCRSDYFLKNENNYGLHVEVRSVTTLLTLASSFAEIIRYLIGDLLKLKVISRILKLFEKNCLSFKSLIFLIIRCIYEIIKRKYPKKLFSKEETERPICMNSHPSFHIFRGTHTKYIVI